MQKYTPLGIALIISLVLTGCTSPVPPTPSLTPSSIPATATIPPTSTDTPQPTPTSTPTSTPDPSAGFMVSSPLQDITLSEIHEIISNAYLAPVPGMDDAHHGVDFAYYSRGSHMMMEGLEIYALLSGKVVGITNNRQRYGNLIIIETPLNTISPAFLSLFDVPAQATPYPYNPRLTGCETLKDADWTMDVSSLYTLYGHMKDPAAFQVGDMVQAGDLIGQVGNTGASGNPHLHLEMRWGPGGTEFASMSHYDGGATPQERLEWCNWRISGKYILLNPMDFINNWISSPQGN